MSHFHEPTHANASVKINKLNTTHNFFVKEKPNIMKYTKTNQVCNQTPNTNEIDQVIKRNINTCEQLTQSKSNTKSRVILKESCFCSRPVTLLSVLVLQGEWGSIANGIAGGGGRYCRNSGKGGRGFYFWNFVDFKPHTSGRRRLFTA